MNPSFGDGYRRRMLVAVAQTQPKLAEAERNLEACLAWLQQAAAQGCKLLVLTECALSGYMFDSEEEAARFAEEVPGPATETLAAACAEHDLHLVVGLLERDGDRLRNTAVLLGPEGLIARYRKTHLPYVGVDRFTLAGNEAYGVHDTPIGRIGMEICYDLRFPEVTRALALEGAEIVAHPTNFPVQARFNTEFVTRARAAENRVFLLTANRVGRERGGAFCGWSQIVDPSGNRLAEADEISEALLVAEIDPAEARDKDFIPEPDKYELRLFDDRRPDLYGALVSPSKATTAHATPK